MPSFNKVILCGHVTRDPQLKYLSNQTAVCEFGLAMNRKWKDANGQQKEEVVFVDCSAWGRVGEVIQQYVSKGHPLLVEGRLKLDQWEDKNGGGKRSKLSVVVEQMQLMGTNGGNQQDGGDDGYDAPAPAAPPQRRAAPARPAPAAAPQPGPSYNDNDIPF